MLKKITISGLISIGINILLCIINLICANMFHFLPLSKSITGGDCVEHIGFGINMLETFPMTTSGELSSTYSISFNFVSLIIPIIVLFILILLIEVFIEKFKKA